WGSRRRSRPVCSEAPIVRRRRSAATRGGFGGRSPLTSRSSAGLLLHVRGRAPLKPPILAALRRGRTTRRRQGAAPPEPGKGTSAGELPRAIPPYASCLDNSIDPPFSSWRSWHSRVARAVPRAVALPIRARLGPLQRKRGRGGGGGGGWGGGGAERPPPEWWGRAGASGPCVVEGSGGSASWRWGCGGSCPRFGRLRVLLACACAARVRAVRVNAALLRGQVPSPVLSLAPGRLLAP